MDNFNNTCSKIEDEFDTCTDDKVYVYETVITRGYLKEESCNTEDQPGSIHNYVGIKEEFVEDPTVIVQQRTTNIKGNYLTCCEGCSEEYDLYCLKCPMLIRIFDSNNPNISGNEIMRTLPRNFVDMCETRCGVGIVALRVIPKGVVFGPFEGFDLTKNGTVRKQVVYTKDPKQSNWMRYIRRVDQSFHPNLRPFRYEDGLYYRSDCHISVGDELLVCLEESATQDCYLTLDDAYACTFCCVGYRTIRHLSAHNSRCPEKRNRNGFSKEIMQCALCKIYVNEKEYSEYHVNRCCERNTKIFALHQDDNDDKPFEYTQPLFKTKTNQRHVPRNSKPFGCSLCSYKAATSSKLKKHIVIHNNDKPFACCLCSYRTKTSSNLKKHTVIHNDDKRFVCAHCPYKTTTNCRLKRHIATHNDDKSFACSLCSLRTKTQGQLAYHILSHKRDKPFRCSQCPYKTKTKLRLKEHIVIHNDDKPFACNLCSYKTRTNSNLKTHMLIHNGDKPFACTDCPYKTTTNSHLRRHIATHNNDKSFTCSLCSFRTNSNSNLKKHIANHEDDTIFACTLCSYKTTKKVKLELHIGIHNGDKPFVCTLCSFITKTNCLLQRHIATHSDDKPFACSFCSYKSRTNSNLKTHLATHKDDKPFGCTQCPFKTKTNYQLKRHIAIHNDDKPFTCSFCSYKARNNSKLKLHIAIHNDDKSLTVPREKEEQLLIEFKA